MGKGRVAEPAGAGESDLSERAAVIFPLLKKEEFLTVHGKGCLRRNSSLWM